MKGKKKSKKIENKINKYVIQENKIELAFLKNWKSLFKL